MQGNPIGHVRTFTPTASGGDAALRMSRALRRLRRQAKRLLRDSSAIAATEFAVIAPLMLMLFFGVVEMSNGITVYRKVSIMAHTLSDLTSQSVSVQDADLANFFAASTGVMTPYPTSPIRQSILELWINSSGQARVQWGKNSDGSTPPAAGTIVSIPAALQVANTYVIYSSVTYSYVPTVGYVMNKAGVTLSDFSYTRPRQSACVLYNTTSGACPTS